jgi:hypothetical protein
MGFAWLFGRRKKKEPAADPAEELKRKLEESRSAEPEAEPPVEQPQRPLDERRDEVHRRGRESIDRMRGEQ